MKVKVIKAKHKSFWYSSALQQMKQKLTEKENE